MPREKTQRAIHAIKEALEAIREADEKTIELEESLRQERDFAQGLLEAAQAVVLVMDTKGRIVSYNKFMEDLTGRDLSGTVGKLWWEEFIPEEDRESIKDLFFRSLRDPLVSRGRMNPILTDTGRAVFVEWTSAVLRHGKTQGLIAVGLDVTDRERVREERKALEARKYQFVANVGHELRTPLSLIKGYATIMVGGDADFSDLTDLNPQQREVMTLMLRRADDLGHLIDDLLTFQELADPEAHAYLTLRKVDLVELGCEIHRTFLPLVTEKGLDLNCACPHEPVLVRGSAKMIGRAWTNLVMNAIKFTDAGQIDMIVRETPNQVIIEVSDTGIGIDPADHDDIFDRFYQADGSAARRHGGSGIGLAVVRGVMEAHGGWVELESAPGAGSTFRLHFRLATRELE